MEVVVDAVHRKPVQQLQIAAHDLPREPQGVLNGGARIQRVGRMRDRGREAVFAQECAEFGEFFVRRHASRTAARIACEKLERVGSDGKRVRAELAVPSRHGQMTANVHDPGP